MQKSLVMLNDESATVLVEPANPNHIRLVIERPFISMTPDMACELGRVLQAYAQIVEPQESRAED